MDSSNVNWEKVEKDITAFGIDIYPLEECTFGEYVGEGAAMEVFEGKCNIKKASKDVAFKHHKGFKKSKLKQSVVDKILEDFRHEITLMKRLKFQTNVVQIYGVTFKERKPILIVELGNETLDKYLLEKAESGTPATWIEKIRLCLDVMRAIHSLHDADIVHGDIKGENVLVFIKTTGIATAKLSDFGYSSTLTSSKGNVGGTLSFMAPEVMGIYPELAQWQKKPPQDIFSFGLVTYQIVNNGKRPYEDSQDVFTVKSSDRDMKMILDDLPSDTPKQFRTIITITTKFIPTDRASTDIVEQTIWDFLAAPSLQQANTVNQESSTIKPTPKSAPPSLDTTKKDQMSPRPDSVLEAVIKPIRHTLPDIDTIVERRNVEPIRKTSYSDLGPAFELLTVEPKPKISHPNLGSVVEPKPTDSPVAERPSALNIANLLCDTLPTRPLNKHSNNVYPTDLGSVRPILRTASPNPSSSGRNETNGSLPTDPTDLGFVRPILRTASPNPSSSGRNETNGSLPGSLPGSIQTSFPSFAQPWSPPTLGTMPDSSHSSIVNSIYPGLNQPQSPPWPSSPVTQSNQSQSSYWPPSPVMQNNQPQSPYWTSPVMQNSQPQSSYWTSSPVMQNNQPQSSSLFNDASLGPDSTLGVMPDLSSSSILEDNTLTLNLYERMKHLEIYYAWNPAYGFLDANRVHYFLMQSNLPLFIQNQIWKLSNIRMSNALNATEFIILGHLTFRMLSGFGLPGTISPALYSAAAGIPTLTYDGEVISPVAFGDKSTYDQYFDNMDITRSGFLSSSETIPFFTSMCVTEPYISHIWRLVDTHRRGRLNRHEFAIAFYLIEKLTVYSDPLPQQLPVNPMLPIRNSGPRLLF